MDQGLKVRCQRIGCEAMFTEEDNADDACRYHFSGPIFHDGTKEWSCCKQRSHDFSLFLALPGCKTGKHTTEKPVIKAVPTANRLTPTPIAASKPADSSKVQCSRCMQGFFCSDHGSQPRPLKTHSDASTTKKSTTPAKKIIGLNEPQTCRNQGCGKIFKEIENHETACVYHPGPAVFHDRMRGWKCCDIHVKEFDEFMAIAPCTKGWHNANPDNAKF